MASDIITIDKIKEMLIPILRDYPVSKAILFGSFAKGRAIDNSDIDLYIDTNGKLRGLDFVGLIETLVNTLGRDIDLVDKSHIEPNSLIGREIEDGGLVIYEREKDYPKDS